MTDLVILDSINLRHFLCNPSGDMMRRFRSLHRESFLVDERILVYIKGEVPWDLLCHLQRVVAALDITNCVIRLVSDYSEIRSMVHKVRDLYASHDETVFEISDDFSDLDMSESTGCVTPLLNPPEHMCMLPWRQLEIKPIGEARTCCVIDSPITVDDLDKPYNINTINRFSWQELYFSKSMKDLRQRFREGEKPEECWKCWKHESDKRLSHRKGFISRNLIDFLETDFESERLDNLRYLDIKPGNLCNLSCRICNSSLSSSWATENLSKVPKNQIKLHPSYQHNVSSRWPIERDDFWKATDEISDQIRHLWLSGGETFMIPNIAIIFNKIKHPEETVITINTNGTIFPEEYFIKWKDFRLVQLMISIDDICDRFEYQRNKADWKSVEDNVKRINEQRSKNIETTLICTVNIQNILYLPELYDWFKQQDFDHLYFNPLSGPNWLRLDQMTTQARFLVIEKLKNYQFGRHQDQIDAILDSIIGMSEGTGYDFCTQTKKLDLIRNQNFSIAHPEMAQAMGYHSD